MRATENRAVGRAGARCAVPQGLTSCWQRRCQRVAAGGAPVDCAAPAATDRGAVLVVPAFYLDSAAFRPLVAELRSRGFNAALPPIKWSDWVPTLGGRSVRPILDRVDYALTQLLEGYQVSEEGGFEIPLPVAASSADWLAEFRDASKGAQPPLPRTGPWSGKQRAALVASSAGGWISRIFLARGPEYSGAVYHGVDRVHTLVTLGTPHVSAEPVTRRNIDFVNDKFPGAHMAPDVRYVAVGSRTVRGRSWLGGTVQDFAWQSYAICCGNGDVWGDGVTPLSCALALDGAELVELEGVQHVPMQARPDEGVHWYGTGPALESWVHWLQEGSSSSRSSSSSSSIGGGSIKTRRTT